MTKDDASEGRRLLSPEQIALLDAVARLERERDAYRAPCWVYDPKAEEDGRGLDRVNYLSALMSDVRSWLSAYPQIRREHPDADALYEGLAEVDRLCDGLMKAVRAELRAGGAATYATIDELTVAASPLASLWKRFLRWARR